MKRQQIERLRDLATDADEYIDNGNFEPEDLGPIRTLVATVLHFADTTVIPTPEQRNEALRLAIGQRYANRAATIKAASEYAAFIADGTQPEQDPQR